MPRTKLLIPKNPTLSPIQTTMIAYGNNTCMFDSNGLIYEGKCRRLEIKNKIYKNDKKESTKG